MEKKEKLRKNLCILFAFLMSVALFVTLVTATLRLTLLNRAFFEDELEKSGYSQTLYEKIIEELATDGYVSGFDEEFFSQVLSVETVNTPVLTLVDRIYGTGEYVEAPIEEISEKLFGEFVKSLESREVVVDEVQGIQIKAFATACANYVSATARLPLSLKAESAVETAQPLCTVVPIFLGAFAVFCVIFIVKTNPKSKEALRYLSYSLTATALMTAAPAIALVATGVLKKFSTADKAYYYLVQTIGNDISHTVLAVAGATLAVSVILTVIYFITPKTNNI